MRSKLGTKSRLAAHILALVLLIFMLVYTSPDSKTVEDQPRRLKPSVSINPAKPAPEADAAKSGVGTLDRVHTPAVATRVEPEQLRPPADPGAPRPERPAPPAPGIAAQTPGQPVTIDSAAALQPHAEPLRPPARTEDTPGDTLPDAGDSGAQDKDNVITELHAAPDAARENDAAQPTAQPTDAPETSATLSAEPATDAAAPETVTPEQTADESAASQSEPAESEDGSEVEDDDAQPSASQPDESGALVVAASETGAIKPIAAATPLANANLEVLGDGVYWLDPRHDLEKELAAVPELRSLILLAPLPGYHVQEFPHVKTEVIPADPADLTPDAADRFIHLTDGANKPVVIAVLPGARGAAFFKGAYLLHYRNMSPDDVLREITPELDDAGESRDDIVHRLMRLKN